MIVDHIERYLEGQHSPNNVVLADMMRRFAKTASRQFFEPVKESGPGSYGPSTATKCVRANYGAWIGAPSEPYGSRAFRFWVGDVVELGMLGLAQKAFEGTPHSIGLNNEYVEVPLGTGGQKRKGYIDGMVSYNHDAAEAAGFAPCRPRRADWVDENGCEDLLVEFKSMNAYPFELFEQNGPDDTWGYLGQVTVYQRALHLRRYVMIGVDPGSGRMHEHVGSYSVGLAATADATFDAVMAAAETGVPPKVPEGYGMEPGGELRMKCRFCPRKAWCFGLQGLVVQARQEKGWKGKPVTKFYAVRGDGTPRSDPSTSLDPGDIIEQLWGKEESK